jgi:stage II sporulation SpoAA-like protein
MIEIIKGLPAKVVAIRARGRVTNEECDIILRPAMELALKSNTKIRLYYEVGSRFPGAGWDDLDVAIDHLPQWERIAVVTDTGWVRQTVNALRFLLASEVRVFTTLQAEEGRTWIAADDTSASAAGPPQRVSQFSQAGLLRERRLSIRSGRRVERRRRHRSYVS